VPVVAERVGAVDRSVGENTLRVRSTWAWLGVGMSGGARGLVVKIVAQIVSSVRM
jgi:hypothetical protein